MKKVAVVLVLAVFAGLCLAPLAVAESCPVGSGDCAKQPCAVKEGTESPCPITSKFFKKASFFLDNKEDLGLSDEQVKKVKSLKNAVKKISIQQMADMQIAMLDFEAAMSEDTIDTEALNAKIDTGMAAMSSSTKSIVAAYAELKGMLSAEQLEKAKVIWKKK